ncbi:MAG: hypothetical protein A2Y12_15120 [Planctomycetes bacterium GWF2_42_9]|nr:MAG: hypothetical protein A2Y12_15120 [Planctomycetes bacterium GWF2_42_9]
MKMKHVNIMLVIFGCWLNIGFATEPLSNKEEPAVSSQSIDDVKARLESSFMKGLLTRTYRSIVQRAQPDGYFQESLTGAYQGMFPRSIGAVGRLFLETEELDKIENILNYCLEAMQDNDMERIPHVIGLRESQLIPVPGKDSPACLNHDIAFAQLGGKNGAVQDFIALDKPLKSLEVYVANFIPGNTLITEIFDSQGAKHAVATRYFDKEVINGWVRLEFVTPVKLVVSEKYRVTFHAENEATNPIIYAGLTPEGTGLLHATQIDNGRDVSNSLYSLAMVFDYGDVDHKQEPFHYKIISQMDQIDGQAHVIMAWAMLALRRGETEFENKTYPVMTKLMNRSVTEPYLFLVPGPRIKPGLVCNISLEHSRDGQYWHTYDFLTQSFICSALENMILVAERRHDKNNAERWSYCLKNLTNNIVQNMTHDFEGKKIFYEMILPTGRKPEPFPGISWLDLAPIPAGWKGVDKEVFKNTIDTWHRVARIDWDGPQMTSSDWLPEGQVDSFGRQISNQVIGKVLGWDLVYCLRAGEYGRVCDMLDFIEKINSSELYAEAFSYDSQSKKWILQDPGNGEQACWWCWAMMVVRREAGLTPLPNN